MLVVCEHSRIDEDMEALAAAFDAELCQDCNERYFSIPEKYGEGRISSFAYDFGVSLLILQGRFLTPLRIQLSGGRPQPIHFHFCVKGDFRHTLNDGALSYQLNPLMGSISTTPSHREQEWLYGRETETVHANLQILRSAFLKKADCDLNKMPAALAGVFRDVEAKKSYLFESNYNLPTAECIREILTNKQKGLTRSTLIEAKAMELLSLQLQQFAEDLDPEIRSVALKKYDLEQILQAEKLLTADLQKEPTIVELARAVGINQQKLKRGFKLVFDMPVKQYLLDVRPEAARCLTLEGYDFPGNVRELENIVERAVILTNGDTLNLRASLSFQQRSGSCPDMNGAFVSFEEMQKQYIIKALQSTNGRVSGPRGAARLLDLNPRTLASKMRRLGIDRENCIE